MTQAYGHRHESQFIVLTCCTAAQTRSVPNVALSSPCTTMKVGGRGRLRSRGLCTNNGPKIFSFGPGLCLNWEKVTRRVPPPCSSDPPWVRQKTPEKNSMMSGLEMTRTILTSCQTHSIPFQIAVLCSQSVLPCRSRSPTRPAPNVALQVPALARPLKVSWVVWVSSPPLPRPLPYPGGEGGGGA